MYQVCNCPSAPLRLRMGHAATGACDLRSCSAGSLLADIELRLQVITGEHCDVSAALHRDIQQQCSTSGSPASFRERSPQSEVASSERVQDLQRATKRDAIALLLTHRDRYLQHSCGNALELLTDLRASATAGGLDAWTQLHSGQDVYAILAMVAEEARELHKRGSISAAMTNWWSLLYVAQIVPGATVNGHLWSPKSQAEASVGDTCLRPAVKIRDALHGVTQQRACEAWVRFWALARATLLYISSDAYANTPA